MKLTIAQMEAFLSTARLGSAVAAAAQLGLTQPSVTLRLQEFQRATGVTAFRRTPQGLRLTAEGRGMLERVASILDLTRTLADQSMSGGPFRLGLAEAFAVACLPQLLPAFDAAVPGLRPEVTVAASRELEDLLLNGRLDLAVLADPMGADLRLSPLGAQRVSWVAGSSFPVPHTATPETFRSLPIIVNPPGSAMHRRMSNWFSTAGIQPENVGHCSSGAVILHLVAAGVAMSLAPEIMVRSYARPGSVRVLPSVPPLAPGHLYLAERLGISNHVADRVSTTLRGLVDGIAYFRPPTAERTA